MKLIVEWCVCNSISLIPRKREEEQQRRREAELQGSLSGVRQVLSALSVSEPKDRVSVESPGASVARKPSKTEWAERSRARCPRRPEEQRKSRGTVWGSSVWRC